MVATTDNPQIFSLDSSALPEVLHLDYLSEDSLYTWNWPVLARRALEEHCIMISHSPYVYHALRRCLKALPGTKSKRILRRQHTDGYVYKIVDVKDPLGPIVTRSGEQLQTSNHGILRKMSQELIDFGGRPDGYVLEVDSYGTAHMVRTIFYGLRKRRRAKVEIQLRVRQPDGSYLPLSQTPNYQQGQRITIFAFPAES